MLALWDRIEGLATALLAAAALVIFLYGMVARFAFPQLAPDWVLEVTIFLLVWAMLLSASALVASGRHVRADLFVRRLPRRAQLVLEASGMLVAAAFCAVLVMSGVEVVGFAFEFDERTLNSLRIPMGYYYASVPVAFSLVALRFLKRFADLLTTREPTFGADQERNLSSSLE